MIDSVRRVTAVINGEMPDRAPMFDLLRNDAVIEHFSGRKLTTENDKEVVYAAFAPAIDATRAMIRVPNKERTILLEDGREQRYFRWTIWTQHKEYRDSESYALIKRKEVESSDPSAWGVEQERSLKAYFQRIDQERRDLGDMFFLPGLVGPGIMGIIDEVGLEAFSYYLADCSDIIIELLEQRTLRAIAQAEHFPENHGLIAGFLGDDIAFNSGTIINPVWMREHYFPCLARIIAAWHARGIKVLFHSDGNLNPVLEDLVAAGIDGLNPIEVLSGMDVADIHKRYPHLFMAGGIDVSQLLPFGSPQEVKDAVVRAIDAAEGRIMIGSSTEMHDEVPLENFLALREAVLETTY